MKYFLFIESVKTKEWEVGAIIENDIKFNPDYEDVRTCHVKITNCIELKEVLVEFKEVVKIEDYAIIHIDAHSNETELGFRNDPNLEDMYNKQSWDDVVKMCDSLFEKYNGSALFVFASCLSALYFKKQPSLSFSVIAAENEVDPHRMEEQLLVFYNSFCSGNSFEQAYNEMIQRFPIEEELTRDEKKQSVLRFYK